MPQSIPIAKHKPSRLDYLLFVPFILFCIAGLLGLFKFTSPALLIAGLIYGLFELSRLPFYMVLGGRAIAMFAMAGLSVFSGVNDTFVEWLLIIAATAYGMANVVFCFTRLPQKQFDSPIIDWTWRQGVYTGEFHTDGSIRKIGAVGGMESQYPPILLYEAEGKKVPFIMGELTSFSEQPQYAAYAVKLESLGSDLASLPRAREFSPRYDHNVFDGAFHGCSFASPAEEKRVAQDILTAMTHCSIAGAEGKEYVFIDAYVDARHSRICTMLQIEHALQMRIEHAERDAYYKTLRCKLHSHARNVEWRLAAFWNKKSIAYGFVEAQRSIDKHVRNMQNVSAEWVAANQRNLDSSEDFLNAFSKTTQDVRLNAVVSLLSKQQHPIIPKLLATLSDEREAFRQRIEAKQKA